MSRLPPISSFFLSPPEPGPLPSFQSFEGKPMKMENTEERLQEAHQLPAAAAPAAKSDEKIATEGQPKEGPGSNRTQQPSPPVSPEKCLAQAQDDTAGRAAVVDPVLFPGSSQDPSGELDSSPLFQSRIDRIVQAHIESRELGEQRGASRRQRCPMPTPDEYKLAVGVLYSIKSLDGYSLKRQRQEDKENYPEAKRLGVAQALPAPTAAAQAQAPAPKRKRASTPKAPRKTSKAGASPATPVSRRDSFGTANSADAPGPKKAAAPRKAIPRAAPGEGGRNGNSSGHTRVREAKKPIDVDWRSRPDMSPKAEPKEPLFVNWEGNPMDVEGLPDLELLRPDEIKLASKLRLTPARYLTCKRQIFEARVNCLRLNKDFKKTDAQQAVQMDVNKASKIWEAYNRAGWLEVKHFTHLL